MVNDTRDSVDYRRGRKRLNATAATRLDSVAVPRVCVANIDQTCRNPIEFRLIRRDKPLLGVSLCGLHYGEFANVALTVARSLGHHDAEFRPVASDDAPLVGGVDTLPFGGSA